MRHSNLREVLFGLFGFVLTWEEYVQTPAWNCGSNFPGRRRTSLTSWEWTRGENLGTPMRFRGHAVLRLPLRLFAEVSAAIDALDAV